MAIRIGNGIVRTISRTSPPVCVSGGCGTSTTTPASRMMVILSAAVSTGIPAELATSLMSCS